jgi:uncharacterized membrane protein
MQNPPGSYPPPQGFQQPGGYPPPGPPTGKTQTLNLDYNIAAGLCYIPVCGISLISSILWLVTEPKSNKFVRFNAIQSLLYGALGIVLYVAQIVVILVVALIGGATGSDAVSSILFFAAVAVFGILWIGLLVTWIIALIKAFTGKMWKVPVIGSLADKWS